MEERDGNGCSPALSSKTAKFVSAAGLAMDIDHDIVMVKARDGDDGKKRQFMLASGMNSSALEHSVPEQLFSTPENPVEGISAVKALQIANEQGIPIYTVTRDNIATVLPQLELYPPLENEIMYSVMAGMEVTVSKTDITYNGWTGCGYIVINPVTGSGGYMISGGMAGGVISIKVLISLFSVSEAEAAQLYSNTNISNIEEDCAYLHSDEYYDCVEDDLAPLLLPIGISLLIGYAGAYVANVIGIIAATIVLVMLTGLILGIRHTCMEQATHCD